MENLKTNFKTMDLQFGLLTITPEVEERLEELGFDAESLLQAVADHKSDCDGNPSIYCGTYGKYNDGSIAGLWIDLSTFNDYDDFIDFCNAIHADEPDPELMFQDYEGFPRDWYEESCPGEDWFNKIKEYCDLCDRYSTDAVDAFIGWGCEELENFEDCYMGKYDSEEDYARELVNECYDIDRMMGSLADYFDYEAYACDLFDYDYYFDDGYVFRRY